MDKLYGISFETYCSYHVGGLVLSRIGKTFFVEITKRDELSFYEHIKAIVLGKIGRRLCFIADITDYKMRVMRGFEKGIVWEHVDGGYIAFDKTAGEYAQVKVKRLPENAKVRR